MVTLPTYQELCARQPNKTLKTMTFWDMLRDSITKTRWETIYRHQCSMKLGGNKLADGYVVIQASTNLHCVLLQCFVTNGSYTNDVPIMKVALEFPDTIPIFEKFGYSYLP